MFFFFFLFSSVSSFTGIVPSYVSYSSSVLQQLYDPKWFEILPYFHQFGASLNDNSSFFCLFTLKKSN